MSSNQERLDDLKARGALWMHDGNPKRPHALLTSGYHSNGFCNLGELTNCPDWLKPAIRDLRREVAVHKATALRAVTAVCGPAHGATTSAYELARQSRCRALSVYWSGEGSKRRLVLRHRVTESDFVLVIEDVLTTGATAMESIKVLEVAGAIVAPMVLALVNRSGLGTLQGRAIIALIDIKLEDWAPEECPLCQMGSKPLRPKERWAELTAYCPKGD